MDNEYLQDLIKEVQERGGGLILNVQDRPEVVVLSIDRYNQLLDRVQVPDTQEKAEMDSVSLGKPGKKVLVTGGAGYIGGHVVKELLKFGHEVVVLDNLSTGKRENVPANVKFIEGDVSDVNLLRDLFASEQFDSVMHMAASLEVEESVRMPVQYLENNVINTEKLLMVMAEAGVKNIIFSSTGAVYGEQETALIKETAHVHPVSPYGYSKLMAERIIKYYCHFVGMKAVIFRYFNACGSDFDGTIADTHKNSHLIPIVLDVVKGNRPLIVVNGNDYQTFDGTCVRDYVHVLDIARAHALALDKIQHLDNYRIYNIGTGHGASVCEVINKVSEVLERMVPMETGPRRPGDAPITVADNSKIKEELGFIPQYSDLETIIKTTWNTISK